MNSISDVRRKVNKLLAEYNHARRTVKEEGVAREVARERLDTTGKAQAVAQSVAQKVQQAAHGRISAVVSRCLAAVFGEDAYTFRIDFVRKRGKTEAVLTFVDKDGNPIDPLDGSGGGAVDVASFALRLASLTFQKPRRRRLVVADEPFKFVSERGGFRERVRELIEALAEELDFQFILVTHDRLLEVGKVVEIKK
jgi:DNA repair exonuclease SbcCD ATPase subunit